MRLFGLKLNSLLVIAVAALLALGTISAFADSDPPDPPGDTVTVDDGDTDGDSDGDTDGDDDDDEDADDAADDADDEADDVDDDDDDVDADVDGDVGPLNHDGDGPNPERGCATGSLDHALGVLGALLEKDHPGENEGILNALEKMCHGGVVLTTGSSGFGDGDGGDSGDHPGNGNAFGRGHGQGKPEGVPTSDGGDE